MTSVVCAPVITVTLARLASLRVEHCIGAQRVLVFDQRHVAHEPRQIDRRLDAGIAAADDRDALALEQSGPSQCGQ